MSGIPRKPPEEGCYRFVVTNRQIHAEGSDVYPFEFISYGERKMSRVIYIPWLEKNQHCLFFNTKPAFDRACAEGWQDITQQWKQHLEENKVGPTTESQQAIMRALSTAWESKSDIVARSQIADSEWRTAIKTLIEKGLAEKKGNTNRSYRYRLAE
jgi:predicted HTH transcriptional regulator